MPPIRDPEAIRAILETDRPWALYPLGDLDRELFAQCQWFVPADGERALMLVVRAYSLPILFTLGDPGSIGSLLEEIGAEPELFIHVRPEIMPLVRERYVEVRHETAMWRMILDPARFEPISWDWVVRLGLDDLPALEKLHADGAATGEAPEFFTASMLESGVYFGVWEGEDLVASAGTHLVVPAEGVGAIDNFYTRRDRRGRGLAARVTGAVAAELVSIGLRTIGLNVSQENLQACRVYERLGFVSYRGYVEGVARGLVRNRL